MISIITPYYETGYLFHRTIESVLSQTFSNFEWIIVDDCSVFKTCESVLSSFFENQVYDPRIKVCILEMNSGPNEARHRGVVEAQGEMICFLDSDDIFLPNKLEDQFAWMKINEINFSHTDTKKIDLNGVVGKDFISRQTVDWRSYLFKRGFPVNTVMISAELASNGLKNLAYSPPRAWRRLPGEDIIFFESFFWKRGSMSRRYPQILSLYSVGESRSSNPIKSIFGLSVYLFFLLIKRKKYFLLGLIPLAWVNILKSRWAHRVQEV